MRHSFSFLGGENIGIYNKIKKVQEFEVQKGRRIYRAGSRSIIGVPKNNSDYPKVEIVRPNLATNRLDPGFAWSRQPTRNPKGGFIM